MSRKKRADTVRPYGMPAAAEQERQRKEKLFHSFTTPKASRQYQMRGALSEFCLCPAHPAEDFHIPETPSRTTKNFKQTGAGPQPHACFAQKHLFF